ncbi:MAG: ATP-binding cassette domain-containing protein, partial [Paeniglutamicibacter terrestris]
MLHAVESGNGPLRHNTTAVSISAKNWGWRHADRAAPALSGLNLQIPAGSKVLLAGPSGAGKSTLLYALAGVLH